MARLSAPMMLHRDHTPPCSADSRRNVPGRSAASLRYTLIGVSASAGTRHPAPGTRHPAPGHYPQHSVKPDVHAESQRRVASL